MSSKQFSNVKELRKSYSLTQDEMSYFIGISVRNYREKERGNIPFSQIEIMKMILLFDLNPDDVFHLFYIKCINASFWKRDNVLTKQKENVLNIMNSRKIKNL